MVRAQQLDIPVLFLGPGERDLPASADECGSPFPEPASGVCGDVQCALGLLRLQQTFQSGLQLPGKDQPETTDNQDSRCPCLCVCVCVCE